MGGPALYLFGSPRIEIDSRPAAFNRTRALALAAYLAAHPTPQSRDLLMTLIWPDFEPAEARNNLRRDLSYLHALLGEPAIRADRQVIAFNHAALAVDLQVFNEHIAAARAHARTHPGALCEACARSLIAAVDLHAAGFLEGFGLPDSPAFEEWQIMESERLRRTAVDALDQLAVWHAGRGDHERVADLATRALALEPFHEPAHRHLMRALAATGRRAEALRHYGRLVEAMAKEVDASPEAATSALSDALRYTPDGERALFTLCRLPAFFTPFVGRAEEVAAAAGLLAEPGTRLLTLVGPGGIGKTRLAVEAARALAGRDHLFYDGIVFVSLAALTSAGALPMAVADALQLSFDQNDVHQSPLDSLITYLAGRRLLLVLDNMEHLLPGGIELPARILREAPGTALLVTSRARLNLTGEHLQVIGGMAVPAESLLDETDLAALGDYDAIRLFDHAARRVRPDFRLTTGNIRAVADICRRLGGLPLAIEMAAAWLEGISLAAIAAELDRGLDILATGMAGIPERQRSIRAVFDTGYRLLNEREQGVLRCLSVFRGGFTLEAAEVVASLPASSSTAYVHILLGLIQKSWLSRDANDRFHVHELIRRFAAEKLGASRDAAHERHARYFADAFDQMRPQLCGPEQRPASLAVAADYDNMRAAWEWCVRHDALDLVAGKMALPAFFYAGLRNQIRPFRNLLDWTLAESDAHRDDVDWLTFRAIRATMTGERWVTDPGLAEVWQRTQALPDPAGALGIWYILLAQEYGLHVDRRAALGIMRDLLTRHEADDSWLLPFTRHHLAELLTASRCEPADAVEARAQLRQAAAEFEQAGNTMYQARALTTLVNLPGNDTPLDERLTLNDRIFALTDSLDNPRSLSQLAAPRVEIFIRLGMPDRALAVYQNLIDRSRARGDRLLVAVGINWMGTYALRYSSIEHALQLRHEGIAAARLAGDLPNEAWCVWNLGEIHRVMCDIPTAADFFNQSIPLFNQLDDPMGRAYVEFGFGSLALLAGDLPTARERLGRYLAMSRAFPWNQWNEANALIWLARAQTVLGEFDDAAARLAEAIGLATHTDHYDLGSPWLAAAAELALAIGQPRLCGRLCALAIPQPYTWIESRSQMEMLAAAVGPQPAYSVLSPTQYEAILDRLADLPSASATAWLAGNAHVLSDGMDVAPHK